MAIRKLKTKIIECTCERCGWPWLAKLAKTDTGRYSPVMPTACARCKSEYWNVTRKEKS